MHWKDWCWSWHSNALATWCEELTYWKRPWCWERLWAGGERDDRGWDGWMALLTRWTWIWTSSGSWWWTGKPGVLQSMESQRVGHDWATELNWNKRTFNVWMEIFRSCLMIIIFSMIIQFIWTVSSDYMVFSLVHPYSAKWRLLNILRSEVRNAIGEAKLIVTIVIVCKSVVISWVFFLQKKKQNLCVCVCVCVCVWEREREREREIGKLVNGLPICWVLEENIVTDQGSWPP